MCLEEDTSSLASSGGHGHASRRVSEKSPTAQYFLLHDLATTAVQLMNRLAGTFRWKLGPISIPSLLSHWAAGEPSSWLRLQGSVREGFRSRSGDEDRQNPLFEAVTSEYPAEALARYACDTLEFRTEELDTIKGIHDLRGNALGRWGWLTRGRQAGLVLAAVALIARIVPEAVVVRLGWDYDTFQWVSFLVLVSVLLAVFLGQPLFWTTSLPEMRRAHALISAILVFLPCLLTSESARQQTVLPTDPTVEP
jgi:hypothetical protein